MTTEAELDAALEAHLKHKGILARRMYGEDESKPVKWDDKTKAAERECLAVALEAAAAVREGQESAAQFLFGLLDDIDTVSDMAKGDDAAYRAAVERIQRRRFEVAETDGYTVTWKATP